MSDNTEAENTTQEELVEETRAPLVVEMQIKPNNEGDWWRGLLMVGGFIAVAFVWLVLACTQTNGPTQRIAESLQETDFRAYPKAMYHNFREYVKGQLKDAEPPPSP